MESAFLQLRNITKRFGDCIALADVSLDVRADELLVVLGPTGAGKTTLLRTIVGLEAPDAGSIAMAGEDMTHHPPAARDAALVFQNFSLYPDRTVRQNMEFPLRAPGRNLSNDRIAKQVAWAAEVLRISHLLDRKAARLSGGEMQRVAIGRAIVRRPRLFLMDEPLTNLDAKLRESLRVELVMLRRELKTPMIFVTHDQAEALSMGDRIVVLSQGQVLQSGIPEEIYRKPISPVVARQLGQPAINLVPVIRKDEVWQTESGTPVLPASTGSFGRATLGIRPEDIEISGGQHEATVLVIENLGPANSLLIEWLGRQFHVLTEKTLNIAPGQKLFPRIREGATIIWPG